MNPRGFVQGERADVLILGIVDKDNIISLEEQAEIENEEEIN
mgnify:CR=1 FL=1